MRTTATKLWADMRHFQPRLATASLALAILVPFLSGINSVILISVLNPKGTAGEPSAAATVGRELESAINAIGISQSLTGVLIVFLILSTLQAALQLLSVVLHSRLRIDFVAALQKRMCRALSQANWTYFRKVRPQDIAHALATETERVFKAVTAIMSLLSNVAMASVYLLFSAWVSPTMSAMTVFGCLAIGPFVVPTFRSARGAGAKLTDQTRRFYRDILDQLAGIKEVKCMGAESYHAKELISLARQTADTRLSFERAKGTALFIFSVGTAIAVSVVVYVAIELLHVPAIDLLLLIVIYSRMTPRVLKMQNDYQDLVHVLPAYSTITELLYECQTHAEEIHALSPESRIRTDEQIVLSDVGFRYTKDSDVWAIRHLNLTLAPHSFTAIVGPSGAGKSTLADILLGLHSPEEGTISVGGETIHNQLHVWRSRIGYVPQETFLLHDTLRANMLMAKPSACDQEIFEALRQASVDELVRSLPDCLDTIVGERGARLSGGERQRISLARALLRRPAILILDEATSALDAENQHRIQKSLEELASKMTIIVIAHRLSSIASAQQIVVMENGELVQIGTYDELASQDGRFREILLSGTGGDDETETNPESANCREYVPAESEQQLHESIRRNESASSLPQTNPV